VIEHEHLVAKHGEPVQIYLALMVFDAGHSGLKLRHMGFERDGDPLAEAARSAIADDA